MNNSKKDIFDKESLIKDITERENIICKYQETKILDRNDAIKKIQELRISDEDIATITSAKLATYSVPFSQSTNDQIIAELIMQKNVLQIKLVKKQMEEQK